MHHTQEVSLTVGFSKKKKRTAPAAGAPPVRKGDVYWVDNLQFTGNIGSKSRPVVVIGPCGEGMVNVMEITSQTSSECPEYLLLDYLSAGLDHESYVKLRARQISRSKLTRKMGALIPEDLENIH